MLLGSAMRIARAPETDEGVDFDDTEIDEAEDALDTDDEGEDDEPDLLDADDSDDDQDEDPEPRKPTRGENRVAAATRKAAEANRRVQELEARLASQEQQRNQVPPEEMQRRRAEHLATLTGDQRQEFLLNEQRQQFDAKLNQLQFQTYDTNDKATFAALVSRSPALAKLEDKVEERLQALRASGGNADRASVAKFLLGEMALAKATRANNSGAKRAAAGKERQQGRPTNGRGDIAPKRDRGSKGDSIEAIEARLRGVRI